ncbi:MAG: hypothetical protein IJU75_07460 [Clostridia bacterium]|nr:hypothetical protein [Clostridia bacterium]
MKVLLMGFGKIAYMPYMNFYLDVLSERADTEIELIYWDRDGKPDSDPPPCVTKTYVFRAYLEEQLPFRKKLKYFCKYRRFALKILRKNKYDRIIVLHMTPGLTVLDYLKRHYRGRYILDFRDISYEYVPVYRKIVSGLAKSAAMTFVSSDAFRSYLPALGNIYTVHNYTEDSLSHRMIHSGKDHGREVIRISYWGLVRHAETNLKIIDSLGGDPRFELHYYGRMQQAGRDMERHAREKKYGNVYFHGQYMPGERFAFAENTDIIHNVYRLDHTMKSAMANKYYDGIIFGIPQISTKGSFMGDLITGKGIGIAIDPGSATIADDIWNYYRGIDWNKFENNCAETLSEVLTEQKTAKEKLLCAL